jgi:hypothetical protein
MNNATINLLDDISKTINLYGNILILIVGNISNIMKIAFFLQHSLRSNSCSYYILAGTFADLFYLNNQPLIRVLRQLNLVGPISSLECSIRSYLQTLSFSLSFTFLILAAFDRYCLTSRDYNRRQLSNTRTATRLIRIVTLSWIIFNTHQFLHHKLHHGMCTARFAHRFLIIYMFIFFCIVPLILLILNILTILNIRSMRHPLRSRLNFQLTLLILLETALTAISILPQTVFMVYFHLSRRVSRSIQQRSIEYFVDVILRLVAYSECSLGFIIYLTFLSNLRRRFFQRICYYNFDRL